MNFLLHTARATHWQHLPPLMVYLKKFFFQSWLTSGAGKRPDILVLYASLLCVCMSIWCNRVWCWLNVYSFDRWYDQKMQVQYVTLKQGILLSWVRIMLLRIKWIFCEFQPKAQIISFNTRVRTIDSMMINAAAGHLWSLLLIEDLIKLYFAEMDGITWDVIPQPFLIYMKWRTILRNLKENFSKL